MTFVGAQDKELAAWMEENVTFPNSMVDRITPATRPADIERLNAQNGTCDEAPVYCEDFIQWVVEDICSRSPSMGNRWCSDDRRCDSI